MNGIGSAGDGGDPETHAFRRVLNLVMLTAALTFVASITLVLHQYIVLNKSAFESYWFPPTEDWTFREWEQTEDGRWSAVVHFYKAREECIYLRDQIVTVTYQTPEGAYGEAAVEFLGDRTPGNNRPKGWQQIDRRLMFDSPKIVAGTLLTGAVLHQCHPGVPTVSGFTGVVVGNQMDWPPFVERWVSAGRKGQPRDYR